jgi:hypothetical protein
MKYVVTMKGPTGQVPLSHSWSREEVIEFLENLFRGPEDSAPAYVTLITMDEVRVNIRRLP